MKMKTTTHMDRNKKALPLRKKHIPLRSCIACREKRNHRELIRLTLGNDGIEISTGKRKEGRGAYLCPIYECWENGLKKNRIDHALRTKISLENRQKLMEYGEKLPKKDEIGK